LTPSPNITAPHSPPFLAKDAKSWTARDGKVFPVTEWRAPRMREPKVVLIGIHGMSGAASDFWPIGEAIAAEGGAAIAYEVRGQGHDPDPKQRGDIPSARAWRQDLADFDALVRLRYPGAPIIWHGESLGSLIALHAAARAQSPPDGIILASPVGEFRESLPAYKYLAVRILAAAAPRYRISLADLAGQSATAAQVTANTTHSGQMSKTAHHVETFTIRHLREIEKMVRQSQSAAPSLRAPLLMLYTPNDPVSTPGGAEAIFNAAGSGQKEKRLFKNSFHLILHDVQRAEAIRSILLWLENFPKISRNPPLRPPAK
jgi:alpha-beta hydrolase superfamily lysophospholipase